LGKVAEKVSTCGEIMNLSCNTIFITGGGSGIGRAFAEGLDQRGNKVLISGRRTGHLEVAVLNGDESQFFVPVRMSRWSCQGASLRSPNNIGRKVPIGRPKRACHPRRF
jgi:short chain dehydrogenase